MKVRVVLTVIGFLGWCFLPGSVEGETGGDRAPARGTVEEVAPSPLFRGQVRRALAEMDLKLESGVPGLGPGFNPVLIWNPVSFSASSGCAGSLCLGSACSLSGCGLSLCWLSGCALSLCSLSGCLGSGCALTGCAGSLCIKSGCIGSGCVRTNCEGSACVESDCYLSFCGHKGSDCKLPKEDAAAVPPTTGSGRVILPRGNHPNACADCGHSHLTLSTPVALSIETDGDRVRIRVGLESPAREILVSRAVSGGRWTVVGRKPASRGITTLVDAAPRPGAIYRVEVVTDLDRMTLHAAAAAR